MADYDFTLDMDAEQIRRAKAAGKLAQKHVKGAPLYEALEIGEVLLTGRAIAMRVSSSSAANGRRYAEAFSAWKRQFGFDVKGQELPKEYFDDCVFVATNRPVAEKIIAEVGPAKRSTLGISGLAARIRKEMKSASETSENKEEEEKEKEKAKIAKINSAIAMSLLNKYGIAILTDNEESDLVIIDQAKFAVLVIKAKPMLLADKEAAAA